MDFTYPPDVGVKNGGTGRWDEFPAKMRDMQNRIATLFAGPTAPVAPEISGLGQLWLDTSGPVPWPLKVFDGTTWDLIEDDIDQFDELRRARGSTSDLSVRLDIALNPDGSLKASTTLNPSQWVAASGALVRLANNQFTIAGDQTALFLVNRRLLFAPTAVATVGARSFAAGVTTVTTVETTVPVGLSAVNYGIISPDLAASSLTSMNIASPSGGVVEDYLGYTIAARSAIVYAAAFGFATGATGAANRTALQAAHDSLNSVSGGTIILPPGLFTVAGTITVNRPTAWLGTNGGGNGGTQLSQATASTTTFALAVDGKCIVQDITIGNSTGSRAIQVDGATSGSANGSSMFERVTIQGGAYGIYFDRAAHWTMRKCYCASQTSAAVHVESNESTVQDSGDSTIIDCLFSGVFCGVEWVGSGGLKVIGTKMIPTGTNSSGVLLQPAAGVLTSIILLDACSIEGGDYAVLGQGATSGNLSTVVLSGSELFGAVNAIALSKTGPVISQIAITGNVIGATATNKTAVNIAQADVIHLADNIIRGQGGGSTVGIAMAAAVTNGFVGPHTMFGIDTPLTCASSGVRLNDVTPVTNAQLPSTCANGSRMYVSNIKNTGDSGYAAGAISATAPATGNEALRLNGAWRTG